MADSLDASTEWSKWHQLPGDVLRLVFDHLGFDSRIACAGVCGHWNRVFLEDAFSGSLVLDENNNRVHGYMVRRHGRRARVLAILDLYPVDVVRVIFRSARLCDRTKMRSLIIAGTKVRPNLYPRVPQIKTDSIHEEHYFSLVMNPKLFFNEEIPIGYELEHLSLIHLSLEHHPWLFDPGNKYDVMLHKTFLALKTLDVVHFTNVNYFPRWIFSFSALEQLCLSTNHLFPESLFHLAKGLPRLNHFIVHAIKRLNVLNPPMDESMWALFHQLRNDTRLSFLLNSPADADAHVPPDVPIHGLEVRIIDKGVELVPTRRFFDAVSRTENLTILCYDDSNPMVLIHFFDELLRGSVGSFKLSRLQKFMFGGSLEVSSFLELAERVAKLPKLLEWAIDGYGVRIHEPHSILAHGSKINEYGLKRRDFVNCQGPNDEQDPLLCISSTFSLFYQRLTAIFPREKLKILAHRTFITTPSFWKAEPVVVQRLRMM